MLKTILLGFFVWFVTASAIAKSANESWKVVPNREVCMVTNVHFARPQIPVTKDGKTYFGCCENCKATIQSDASSRAGLDPVSKRPVDKAKATIAANSDGTVLYFESKANFDRYVSEISKSIGK